MVEISPSSRDDVWGCSGARKGSHTWHRCGDFFLLIVVFAVISTAGRNLKPDMPLFYVYLLTNKNNKVMYVGITNNLERRVYEHKTKQVSGFTEKYNVNKLVYFEETSDVQAAITREKEIKKWRREKKNRLVLAANPEWKDLSEGGFEISPCGRDDEMNTVS